MFVGLRHKILYVMMQMHSAELSTLWQTTQAHLKAEVCQWGVIYVPACNMRVLTGGRPPLHNYDHHDGDDH